MYPFNGLARLSKLGSIGILSLVLIACGGGGSSSSAPVNPPVSDTTPPTITMVGAEAINHEQGTAYDDQGASASDSVDGAVSVSSSGEVGNTAGVYTITYSASDAAGNTATATRTITVADTQPPVISLIGDSEVSHEQGANYIDAGASASDLVDGDVEVLISGDVDDEVGEYTVTFTATDAADNAATQTRLVTVVSPDTPQAISLSVLDNGEADSAFDAGLNGQDSTNNWGTSCSQDGGAACPNLSWQIVADVDRGNVLQIAHSAAGQQAIFFVKTNSPMDLSAYSTGNIIFDIKTVTGDSNYTMKVDCVYPCTSGDKAIGSHGASGWETVTVPVAELVSAGLQLVSVDTGIVIWASAYTSTIFQLDNVRWEGIDDGTGGTPTGGTPMGGDDGWVIPSFSGYQSPNSYNGYDLVWSDEFDGSQLDSSDWSFEIGTGFEGGWGNNELQYYTDRNLYLKDGMLVIRADEESFGGRSYTSSRIKTQGKQNFQYGRIDIRARMPEGQGIWPALWMLGENINQVSWPYCGELDVMEMVGGGNGKDNRTVGTAHWNAGGLDASYSPANFGSEKILPENLSANFHVYSIVWTSYRITWYVDDVQYHVMAIDNSASLAAFQKQFFMIFNVAVGGDWPGSPDSYTVFPQRMVVDYIRVFQDENGSTGGQSGSTHPVPGLIEAEDYNDMLGVQIETTTDTGIGFNVGYIDEGDWVEYSLDVANAGNYLIEYRLASQNGSDGFQTLIDGIQIDAQSVPNTGGWQSWITNSATVNLSAGEQTLRLNAVGSEWNLNWIKFTAQ
jgi:beta-glucanase (GH16 family)